MKNDVNGKQVAAGCFVFILIAVVIAVVGESGGFKAFLGIIAIIVLNITYVRINIINISLII